VEFVRKHSMVKKRIARQLKVLIAIVLLLIIQLIIVGVKVKNSNHLPSTDPVEHTEVSSLFEK